MLTAPQSIAMLQDWRQHWGQPLAPSRENCMCRFMVENIYGPRYYWYNWMSTLQCACPRRSQPQASKPTTSHPPHTHSDRNPGDCSSSACCVRRKGVFDQSIETRPQNQTVMWPADANFAVGAATVRAAPRWFYELLLKLHVTEKLCQGGSIQWAHTMERMWFEIFDPAVPKTKTWLSAKPEPGKLLPPKLGCLASAVEGDPNRAGRLSATRRLSTARRGLSVA